MLTGTIGAGKTTTAEAMSEILHEQGKRHALLDLDWLDQLYPPPDQHDPFNMELGLRNLAAIWPNFRRAGAERLVMAATIENSAQLAGVRSALPDVDLTVCLIAASPHLVAKRINERDHGRLRDDFLGRTDELAAAIEGAAIADFSVRNEGGRGEAARAVLDRLGW